jgi:iron complex outermembrane recepter protein
MTRETAKRTTAMRTRLAALASLVPLAFCAQGQAQQLEEIIVTAQKRTENVQDTPLSVTAIAGPVLEAASITTVRDLSRMDPTLQIGQATGTVTTFIRGIGNPVTTAGNEASVPVYIDDVYFIRAGFPFFDLANIERVEVLKGPQGTLFGRNASGGVISMHTRDPGEEAEVKGKIGYGNYDTVYGQLYAATPLGDHLAVDISFSGLDQKNGWGDNLTTGKDAWVQDYISLRSKWVWTPSETTTVKLIGYYQDSYSEQGIYARAFEKTVAGTPNWLREAPARPNPPSYGNPRPYKLSDFYDVSMDTTQFDDSEGGGASLHVDQEFSILDFVSITAFRDNDELYRADGDYSPFDFKQYDLHIRDKQFSQEFQFKSKADSRVNWIAGLYYLDAKQGFDPTTIVGQAFRGAPDDPASSIGIDRIDIYGKQDVKSYAAFGQLTYPITDDTNLTVGLRYTKDEIEGEGTTDITFLPGLFGPGPFTLTAQTFDANNNFGGTAAVPIVNGSNPDYDPSFNKWTYKIALDHHLNDATMVYANVSRGYKSGTFNTLPLDSPALDPEVVDAYEIGMKSEFLDRRVRVNGALFWNDIDSPQVQAQRNGLVFLVNAGKARTKGVEIDATALLTDTLTARIAASYLDAKFREFSDAPTYRYDSAADPWCGSNAVSVSGAPYPTCGQLVTTSTDAAGNDMPYASKFKLSSNLNYVREVESMGTFVLDLFVSYYSDYAWDADNVIEEPANTLVDGAIAFTPQAAEALTIRLWVKNAMDEEYNLGYYSQASGSAYSASPGAPRTYGAEFLFQF